MRRPRLATLIVWLRIAAAGVLIGGALLAWHWLPHSPNSIEELGAWLTPYRHAWWALPVVILVFVVFGVALVPVMFLIAVTGIAFGPVLGPLYAMAGSLASASTGFAIGRWVGLRRVQSFGGERISRLTRALKRNGTLAVYFVRKVPAPFTLVNIVIGASTVRYRDFLVGTALGMIAVVIALAGFGHQFTEFLRDPSPRTLGSVALVIGIPMALAWTINRMLQRTRHAG